MKNKRAAFFCCFFCIIFIGFAQNVSIIENYNVEGFDLSIYIPKDYNANNIHKVIYVNDGQWLFKPTGLQLKKKLDSLIDQKVIPPVIVVGIHSNANRTAIYVPYKINDAPYFESKATTYAKTLTKKIIPFVEEKYSTLKSKGGRAIFGFSFGGLNATWLSINYPDYFSFSAGFSPSFWVANHQIIKDVAHSKSTTTFWFDIGTAEWNYYVPFIEKAKQQGGVYGTSIFYYEVPGGAHTLEDWKKRITYPVILFASEKKGHIQNWKVAVEVIKSQSRQGIFYQRINPILILDNGVRYSLADQATFEVLNKEDGKVLSDGRFQFLTQQNLKIKISYKHLQKIITVNYKEIQSKKE